MSHLGRQALPGGGVCVQAGGKKIARFRNGKGEEESSGMINWDETDRGIDKRMRNKRNFGRKRYGK
jgi:hypothetical protein